MTMESTPVLTDATGADERESSVGNAWIWLLIFLPLVWAILLCAIAFAGLSVVYDPRYQMPSNLDPGGGTRFVVSTIAIAIAGAVVGLALEIFGIFCAYRDRRHLRGVPIERPFGWKWPFLASVLTPVYSIGRSVIVRRRNGQGTGLLTASIVVSVGAAVIAFVCAVFVVIAIVFATLYTLTGP